MYFIVITMFKRGKMMVDLAKKQIKSEKTAPGEIATGKNSQINNNNFCPQCYLKYS